VKRKRALAEQALMKKDFKRILDIFSSNCEKMIGSSYQQFLTNSFWNTGINFQNSPLKK